MRISLNSIRAFVVTARHGSILTASEELGVTAGAISQQVKKLEAELGVSLLKRHNNAISLTEEGRRFSEETGPAISRIDNAAKAVSGRAGELVVRASVTLAIRWLIPVLDGFKQHHPDISIRVETTHLSEFKLEGNVDLGITYRRFPAAEHSRRQGEQLLLRDFSRPVVSPALLEHCGYQGLSDIARIPALQCSDANWDWSYWTKRAQIEPAELRLADRFDIDDAAIRAAVAGLGMVLAPKLTTEAETTSGTLVELPGAPSVEVGAFYLSSHALGTRAAEKFRIWLHRQVERKADP